ncbi:hypothetical protein GM556_08150 [Bombella sp. ESL0378]|uniref:hypothetical protein n=1 Tax=Bombella sp. ESL0378 TaxID=2676442 RepID=UPI0012D94E19|nr:hypothetical protein [Bombella sp. ESL0378]MUG05504.1 hypothetical protein [Bombella sp. ESL0378]
MPLSSPFEHMTAANAHHLWLLDATGQMMSHDSLADAIILQPFTAHQLPGLALYLKAPLTSYEDNPPLTARFHKRISLPFPLPESDIIPTSRGLITLRNAETNRHWLTFRSEDNTLDFTAESQDEASSFLPLTLEGYKGLARLIDQNHAELRALNQHVIGPAHVSSEVPFHLHIGEIDVPLPENLSELTRLGQLPAGQQDVITLQHGDDPSLASTFIIHINM